MPFTDPVPPGSEEMTGSPADDCGGATTLCALRPDEPLTHTPGNRSDVPHGQLSAVAGEAVANVPAANATAHPKTRIPRFTATITLPEDSFDPRPP